MDPNTALFHLRKDPLLKKLIEQSTEPTWEDRSNLFLALIRSINSQQLSTHAAAAIFARFKQLLGDITPEKILATKDESLRSCGISFTKIKYIKNLAFSVQEEEVDLESIKDLSDEQVIEELVKLNGVGKWTAEMILIFALRRPDVFSVGDLGLRNAVAKIYGVDRDDFETIEKITAHWSPYRSLACRYLWQSLRNIPSFCFRRNDTGIL